MSPLLACWCWVVVRHTTNPDAAASRFLRGPCWRRPPPCILLETAKISRLAFPLSREICTLRTGFDSGLPDPVRRVLMDAWRVCTGHGCHHMT